MARSVFDVARHLTTSSGELDAIGANTAGEATALIKSLYMAQIAWFGWLWLRGGPPHGLWSGGIVAISPPPRSEGDRGPLVLECEGGPSGGGGGARAGGGVRGRGAAALFD